MGNILCQSDEPEGEVPDNIQPSRSQIIELKTVEGYMIKQKIHDNNNGIEIFTADKLGITYCIKVYHHMHKQRFQREVDILRYPNEFMAQMKTSIESNERLYIVMLYYNAGTLREMIKDKPNGKFTNKEARFYICEIVAALQILHNMNIIYNNLNTDQIMISSTGHIRLIGFGKQSECEAPEGIASEAADWWCVGAILYEMLTGFQPYHAVNDTQEQIQYKKLKGKLNINNDQSIPKDSKQLLIKLLNNSPQLRLCNYNDIIQDEYFRGVRWNDVNNKRIQPPIQPAIKDSFDMGVSRIQLSYAADSELGRPYNRVIKEHQLLISQNTIIQPIDPNLPIESSL